MSFLAIDLGASFIKGAILDLEKMCLKNVLRFPFPGFINGPSPFHREVDPEAILSVFTELLHDLLSFAPECAGIVMCGQMHGLILTDSRGKPLSNFISWQDKRILQPHPLPNENETYFDALSKRISPVERQQLGNELRPGLPICSLFWMHEKKELPAGAIPASLPDFILTNLCGNRVGMEPTMAAAHGMLNLETLEWHHSVIENLGLGDLQWPPVCSTGEIVGALKSTSRQVACYAPVGDHQCTVVGACTDSDELSINIGTGSQVSFICSQREYGDYQTRPFFDGQFLRTITHIPAGRSLNALIKLLTELTKGGEIDLSEPWTNIAQAVGKIKNTDLSVNLTFFPGSFGDRGEISNIREDNLTVGHLFRAAFENMANNYWACASRLSVKKSWRNLVFSGGLAQKLPVLREIIAQKFQTGYKVSPSSEDTLLGLLVLARFFTDHSINTLRQLTEKVRQSYSEKNSIIFEKFSSKNQ